MRWWLWTPESYFPSAFNSSPVLAPCLRRRSAVSVCFCIMATSSGVLSYLSFAFPSAPSSMACLAASMFFLQFPQILALYLLLDSRTPPAPRLAIVISSCFMSPKILAYVIRQYFYSGDKGQFNAPTRLNWIIGGINCFWSTKHNKNRHKTDLCIHCMYTKLFSIRQSESSFLRIDQRPNPSIMQYFLW